jgi:hypothetical protein
MQLICGKVFSLDKSWDQLDRYSNGAIKFSWKYEPLRVSPTHTFKYASSNRIKCYQLVVSYCLRRMLSSEECFEGTVRFTCRLATVVLMPSPVNEFRYSRSRSMQVETCLP